MSKNKNNKGHIISDIENNKGQISNVTQGEQKSILDYATSTPVLLFIVFLVLVVLLATGVIDSKAFTDLIKSAINKFNS